jgi:prepilin-type N-terminal cleavage/methylation domain-containing protein
LLKKHIFMREAHTKIISRKSSYSKGGFTLIEMMVAVSLFITAITLAVGIMAGVTEVQRKTALLQQLQDDIRFSLELMTKEMRMGTDFSTIGCGEGGIFFNTFFNPANKVEQRAYFLESGRMMRIQKDAGVLINCADAEPFTADSVSVANLGFILRGTNPLMGARDGQPRVTISISVEANHPSIRQRSYFNIQTTVVQRLRDIALP